MIYKTPAPIQKKQIKWQDTPEGAIGKFGTQGSFYTIEHNAVTKQYEITVSIGKYNITSHVNYSNDSNKSLDNMKRIAQLHCDANFNHSDKPSSIRDTRTLRR